MPEVHRQRGTTQPERQDRAPEEIAASQEGTAAAGPAAAASAAGGQAAAAAAAAPRRQFVPRERAVPSSSVGRVLGFAQLGTSLLYGAAREGVSRALGGRRSEDRCGEAGCQGVGGQEREVAWWGALPPRSP